MSEIRLAHGLPFVNVELVYQERRIAIENVLVDTGSKGTVFSADKLDGVGVRFERGDPVHRIRGVGGTEFVFAKRVDSLVLGEAVVEDFLIEVGAMEYGFDIDGILGMDYLLHIGAILDLRTLLVDAAR